MISFSELRADEKAKVRWIIASLENRNLGTQETYLVSDIIALT